MNTMQVARTARWPRWATWGAAAWSLAYGGLGLFWAYGGAGFPFGEGDVPDARAESFLGTATAAGTAPVIAGLGLAGALLAVAMTRDWGGSATTRSGESGARRWGGVARVAMLGPAWAMAFLLVVLVPDARIMTAVGYAPIFLVGLPFGWPDANYFELAFPWPVVNMLICLAGGLLWAGAALAVTRRSAGACQSCGRTEAHAAHWSTPAGAARWGRWAAYTAFAVPLFYSVVRWAWALKIPLLFSEEGIRWLHETGMAWAGAGLATFGAVGGVLTLGLVRPWGEVWPRWVPVLAGRPVPRKLPLGAAGAVTAILASAGAVAVRVTDWTDPSSWLVSPMAYWPVWAVALGLATLAYYYRTRPACPRCGLGGR
ncbi:hypothetical protein [Nonomuraea endophytica]|uniref:Uncharacterized protein n=1 Tax=Nonomuraea endophytica TaxID=714136 RepID=A0A7W8EGW3_9ACTN|nr:hypothetical protein [Nonomuraea endophytica]MBB5078908.1 hypothetical protein [Nonomuraea endophytica]